MHVGDAGLGRDVGEGPVARVAEQVAAPVAADGEQVEPAVVVEIGEGGERRATRQDDARGLRRLAEEAGPHAVEVQRGLPLLGRPGGHEEIVHTVAVHVAGGDRRRMDGRGRRRRRRARRWRVRHRATRR